MPGSTHSDHSPIEWGNHARTPTPSRLNSETEPSMEASSMPISGSRGTSSTRSTPSEPIPPPANAPQGVRLCQTARRRVILPGQTPGQPSRGVTTSAVSPRPSQSSGSRLHPSDPYAPPPSGRVTDRYAWQALTSHHAPHAEEVGPSRTVTGIPSGYPLTPEMIQSLRNMATDLLRFHRDSEEQAQLMFELSDATHRLSDNAVRARALSESTRRTVQCLVTTCLILGFLVALVIFKMLLDALH